MKSKPRLPASHHLSQIWSSLAHWFNVCVRCCTMLGVLVCFNPCDNQVTHWLTQRTRPSEPPSPAPPATTTIPTRCPTPWHPVHPHQPLQLDQVCVLRQYGRPEQASKWNMFVCVCEIERHKILRVCVRSHGQRLTFTHLSSPLLCSRRDHSHVW